MLTYLQRLSVLILCMMSSGGEQYSKFQIRTVYRIFMPPTLKKVGGHIASGLSVHLFVCHAFWCIA